MADDAVLQILQRIQASIIAWDEKTQASIAALDDKTQASIAALDEKTQKLISSLDGKVTRQHAIVSQDVRMIRAAIHDMGETRVTEGEIEALHEDVNRVQQRLEDLTTRVETLEGHRD